MFPILSMFLNGGGSINSKTCNHTRQSGGKMDSIPVRLQALPAAELSQVARQALRSPAAELLECASSA